MACTPVGVGLRRAHWDAALAQPGEQLDCIELLADNWLEVGGRGAQVLAEVATRWPVTVHGVALSIGGPAPLDTAYLDRVAALCARVDAGLYSDHLCYSSAWGVEYHELVPLPFTHAAVERVVERARRVRAHVPVPFALENPSYYVAFPEADFDEAEFIRRVVEGADCGLLLDVNNVYVNGRNHGYDPLDFIERLPLERVVQLHLAGFSDRTDVLVDTHGAPADEAVLALYRAVLERVGPVPTIIEWDNDIPPFDALLSECARARWAAGAAGA